MNGSSQTNSEAFVAMRALEEGELYNQMATTENVTPTENTDVWATPALPRHGGSPTGSQTDLQVADVDAAELQNDELLRQHMPLAEEPLRPPLQGPLSPQSREDTAFHDRGEQLLGARSSHASSAVHWLEAAPEGSSLPSTATSVSPPLLPTSAPSSFPLRYHQSQTAMLGNATSSSSLAFWLVPTDLGSNLPDGAVSSSMASTGMVEDSAACSGSADSNFAAVAADTDIGLQFSCPICLEVCEDAVETPCCHNLFCGRCLLSEEHRISVCPICKSHLQVDDVRPNVPVRRIVADLPCNCRFDGCGIKLRRRDRVRHEAQCDFTPVQCRFSPDCPPLLRSQLARHEAEECQHRPILCPMNCGASIARMQLDDHLGRDCPCWLCTCEYCESAVCRADLDEHVRLHCQLAIVVCGLREADTEACCEHRCERRLLHKHRQDCPFRPAECPHAGCSHITTARLLPSHQENCEWRVISCQWCGTELCMGSLHQHLEDVCSEYEMPCPFSVHGCTEHVPRRLMDMHLQQATSKHLSCVCETLRVRELEIDSLRSEVVRMRTDFNQRFSNLAAFMTPSVRPVRPPAPPPPPPPNLSRPLAPPLPGIYVHNPVPSSLAETHPAPGSLPSGGQWIRDGPGFWQNMQTPGSQGARWNRPGRMNSPFFHRGNEQEQGQSQSEWSGSSNNRGMSSQQHSDQSPARGLRSPTRIPPPPFLQQSGPMTGNHQTFGIDQREEIVYAMPWPTSHGMPTMADAGPNSNVPTEHAPLIQGMESGNSESPSDLSRSSHQGAEYPGTMMPRLWIASGRLFPGRPPPTLPPPPPAEGWEGQYDENIGIEAID